MYKNTWASMKRMIELKVTILSIKAAGKTIVKLTVAIKKTIKNLQLSSRSIHCPIM